MVIDTLDRALETLGKLESYHDGDSRFDLTPIRQVLTNLSNIRGAVATPAEIDLRPVEGEIATRDGLRPAVVGGGSISNTADTETAEPSDESDIITTNDVLETSDPTAPDAAPVASTRRKK